MSAISATSSRNSLFVLMLNGTYLTFPFLALSADTSIVLALKSIFSAVNVKASVIRNPVSVTNVISTLSLNPANVRLSVAFRLL